MMSPMRTASAPQWNSAVKDSTALFKSLNETGGYAFTHLGLLGRRDGAAFAAQDADDK